jgi:hypothetical protein
MKRFTEKELQQYIQREVERVCIAENLIKSKKNITKIEEPKQIVFENSNNEIVEESEKVNIEEVKLLAEELTRMKRLVDFRSPLLKRD